MGGGIGLSRFLRETCPPAVISGMGNLTALLDKALLGVELAFGWFEGGLKSAIGQYWPSSTGEDAEVTN